MIKYSLHGIWTYNGKEIHIPGTLDTNGFGNPDLPVNLWKSQEAEAKNQSTSSITVESDVSTPVIRTRLTRNKTYEGLVEFHKDILVSNSDLLSTVDVQHHRIFLDIERSRDVKLSWNQREVAAYYPGTLSTPYCFEVTPYLQDTNCIRVSCDNSYPNWPKSSITYSSTATDETQTNWNGLLGEVCLRIEKRNFIRCLRVYPEAIFTENNKLQHFILQLKLELDIDIPLESELVVKCSELKIFQSLPVKLDKGIHCLEFDPIQINEGFETWDEYQGQLYEIEVSSQDLERYSTHFGLRDFKDLRLNGRKFFLRSESNCCVFPKTGHMPMEVDSWIDILMTYQSYGVNCVRFHSHCPPKAAFIAADRLGMLIQPELSHWDPAHAFEEENSQIYYRTELTQILYHYANHPSFVMLSLGNELQANEYGHQQMDELLKLAKSYDPTRLYANGSNVHYGNIPADQGSDFYTASNYYDSPLRACYSGMQGYLNHDYPSTLHHYEESVARIRKDYQGPIFSFEVGQYEVLPDFDELIDYTGVTRADNIEYIRQQVIKKNLLPQWKQRVEASGELSRLAYREEVEAVLRTPSMRGISLLGLQDFPGQGTALVGMLNSHLKAKPFSFAKAERFREFFTDILPLALFSKYTYTQNEQFEAEIKIANYGKKDETHPTHCRLLFDQEVLWEKTIDSTCAPCGNLTSIATIQIPLSQFDVPRKLIFQITYGDRMNSYPIWSYPDIPMISLANDPKLSQVIGSVLLTGNYEEALIALALGRSVLFSPQATENELGRSISSQFTTDFWSVGTFATQSGCMGCLIKKDHPAFSMFPTDFYTDYQWWPMTNGRAMLLPDHIEPIVNVLDSYAYLRHMGLLFESQVGKGKLMFSSMGLLEKQAYPEVRALMNSLLQYMNSSNFAPTQTLDQDEFLSFKSPSYEK